MTENNRGLLIVLGVLVLVVLIAPSIGGMLGPLGGTPSPTSQQGAPPVTQSANPTPGGAATPGVVGGLTSGLAAGLSSLSMLALWGVLIVGVVLLVSRLGSMSIGTGRRVEDEALSTLRRRYAAGEISREEYERMQEVLLGHPERTGTNTPAQGTATRREGTSGTEPWSTETRSDRGQG